MSTAGEKSGWLGWIAAALAAPAFIVPAILVAIATIHYYQNAGRPIFLCDATLLGAYVGSTFLAPRMRASWKWWFASLAGLTILAATIWFPLASGEIMWLLVLIVAQPISNSPAMNRWRA